VIARTAEERALLRDCFQLAQRAYPAPDHDLVHLEPATSTVVVVVDRKRADSEGGVDLADALRRLLPRLERRALRHERAADLAAGRVSP
jgi:hypothetical protein